MAFKVAIDPGHGMGNRRAGVYDSGAVVAGVAEAQVVLSLGLTLAWVLRSRSYETWISRSDDSTPDPIGSRDDRAKAAGCDCFISLHCNSADDPAAHGSEVFYRDTADRNMGIHVLGTLCATLGTRNRGVKRETDSQHPRLAVLDFDGPACLLELAFLSNAAERALLKKIILNRNHRIAVATAIADGIGKAFELT